MTKRDDPRAAALLTARTRHARRERNRALWIAERMRKVGAVGNAKRKAKADLEQAARAKPVDAGKA